MEEGTAVSFHGPVTDPYAKWEALENPDADFGPAIGGGRTNVMGFTNVTSADMKFDDWVKAGYPVAKPKK